MNFGVIVSWTFVLLALSCSTAHGDYVSHSDGKEGHKNITAFTIVIVLGVILAIQFLVFVFFACKGWDAVFGSRSVRSDLESQLPNEFPFLPSYEMAMNEGRESQQNINTIPESQAIDNGVILEIGNTRVSPSTDSQSNIIEVNDSVNTPRHYSLDDEDVSEIRNSNVNPVVQGAHDSVEEQEEANVTLSSGNYNGHNEVDLSIGLSSVHTS